jgi:hypothetical protein
VLALLEKPSIAQSGTILDLKPISIAAGKGFRKPRFSQPSPGYHELISGLIYF